MNSTCSSYNAFSIPVLISLIEKYCRSFSYNCHASFFRTFSRRLRTGLSSSQSMTDIILKKPYFLSSQTQKSMLRLEEKHNQVLPVNSLMQLNDALLFGDIPAFNFLLQKTKNVCSLNPKTHQVIIHLYTLLPTKRTVQFVS